ncbi:MAG: glycosyltransferase [Chthoniobacterales bacterium]
MKVSFVALSVSRQGGGLFDAVRRVAQELCRIGDSVIVYSIRDSDSARDVASWAPVDVRLFEGRGPAAAGFSPDLRRAVMASESDVFVTHVLWQCLSRAVSRWSSDRRKPYVVNPHGMLDPWAIANSRWKKQIAGVLYENRHLREASCIRALSHPEAEAIRAYGLRNPICIIPNGVDLPTNSLSEKQPPPWAHVEALHAQKILLSFGRLHPKKNLRALLHAWRFLKNEGAQRFREWKLVIAGWDQRGYRDELQRLTVALAIDNDVYFAGSLYGADKEAAYRNADAFILPSLSEGLPMAALEAHAYQLPALLTHECNLPESFEAGAAIQIGTGAESIATGLRGLSAMSDAERKHIGALGRELVARKFNWPALGREMHNVLAWITGGGERPTSVLD